jgi:hypothetical protein
MYFSDPQTMDRPELTFDARIAQLHESFGGAPKHRPAADVSN